jgi:NADH:ubiquinone oxidoreductase subunit 2 (subunit N)
MNIYIYIFILYTFFSLLLIFDTKKIKTLTNLKIFNKNNFLSITTVLIVLSMAGIPPLVGFVGKFLIFNYLFFSQKYLYICVFSFMNFFSIYFYIQNLRFLISKTQKNFFLKNGFYVFYNKKLINLIVLLNLINFFGILYMEDFLYFFINLLLLKNCY